MGKQARKKKDKKKADAEESAPLDETISSSVTPEGDLRLVDLHVQHWLKGEKEAEAALMALGRDASCTVVQIAERLGNEALLTFGKRLVAVRPRVDTNFWELREASVTALILAAREKAPKAIEAGAIPISGFTVAIFDPLRVADALIRGGRPRGDAKRVGKGDLAWFARPGQEQATLTFHDHGPPEEADAPALRLSVASGVIFVGPPEASDGPRMGSIRIDPFRTRLDEAAGRGRFLRVDPGEYTIHVHASALGKLDIHLSPAPEGAAPLEVNLEALVVYPPASVEPALVADPA